MGSNGLWAGDTLGFGLWAERAPFNGLRVGDFIGFSEPYKYLNFNMVFNLNGSVIQCMYTINERQKILDNISGGHIHAISLDCKGI